MLLKGFFAMYGLRGAIVAGIGCAFAAEPVWFGSELAGPAGVGVDAEATAADAPSAQSASAAERRRAWDVDMWPLGGFIRCAVWSAGRPFAALVRVRHRRALGAVTAVIWVLVLLLAPEMPASGPFAACAATCPPNALQVFTGAEDAGRLLGDAANAVTVASLVAVAGLLLARTRESAPAFRRTLTPLCVGAGRGPGVT